jgi:hypothetical protein
MKRRELIASAGTALLAWPLVARAQAQAKMARLGYLGFGAPAASANRVEALRAGLRDLAYVEGMNLVPHHPPRQRTPYSPAPASRRSITSVTRESRVGASRARARSPS